MSLFPGYKRAHGIYSKELLQEDGGKMKGKAFTKLADVTVELWNWHIAGKQGLGVIPVNEDGQVKFAAIDIDRYPLDLTELNKQIRSYDLPLTLCRSKSGGAHLFLFLADWIDAKTVVDKMREFASILGYGNTEIFPKQVRINPERGDFGSWINMPYFDVAETKRYAITDDNKSADVEDFIRIANQRKLTLSELVGFSLKHRDKLTDGPPCLNHLASLGFPEGTRNNGLFNLGVYAQKLSPSNWEPLIEKYNQELLNPPLPTMEVLGLIKSLRKREFQYTCKQPPIQQYCNSVKCRLCKHGIGTLGTGLPRFGSLTKLLTDPVIWFLEVEGGGRLELTTDELQSQILFQRKCMSTLNIVPPGLKKLDWETTLRELMDAVTIVELPEEMTPQGQLKQHLEDFCTTRAQARTQEEILLGKPWTSNGFHYFRLRDFMEYLSRKKFFTVEQNKIASLLKAWGAGSRFFNLHGKGINCMKLEEFKNYQLVTHELAQQKSMNQF